MQAATARTPDRQGGASLQTAAMQFNAMARMVRGTCERGQQTAGGQVAVWLCLRMVVRTRVVVLARWGRGGGAVIYLRCTDPLCAGSDHLHAASA